MQTPGTISDENSYQFYPNFAKSPGLKHVDRLFNKNRKVNKKKKDKQTNKNPPQKTTPDRQLTAFKKEVPKYKI